MKPLNLTKALELYSILHEHLPEYDENEDSLEFIGKIVKNIRNSENKRAFVDAIKLMTDIPVETIIQHDPMDAVEIFYEGLKVNDIVSLHEFAKRINYNA